MKRFVLLLLTTVSLTLVASPLFAAPPATAPPTSATSKATAAAAATVNINTASAAELQSLPGIGKVTAESIVTYRTEKGRFKTAQDLLKVKGIGPKTLEKIKNLVSIE